VVTESSVSSPISNHEMFPLKWVQDIQNSLVSFGLLVVLAGFSPSLFPQTPKSQVNSIGDGRGMSFLSNDELLDQTESILNRGDGGQQ